MKASFGIKVKKRAGQVCLERKIKERKLWNG